MHFRYHCNDFGHRPEDGKSEANFHHHGTKHNKSHGLQKNCRGYGFRYLFEILETENEIIKSYKETEKNILIKKLNNYLHKLKNLQNKVEEKINLMTQSSE